MLFSRHMVRHTSRGFVMHPVNELWLVNPFSYFAFSSCGLFQGAWLKFPPKSEYFYIFLIVPGHCYIYKDYTCKPHRHLFVLTCVASFCSYSGIVIRAHYTCMRHSPPRPLVYPRFVTPNTFILHPRLSTRTSVASLHLDPTPSCYIHLHVLTCVASFCYLYTQRPHPTPTP